MKKILVTLLAFILLFSTLTACSGDKKTAAGSKKVTAGFIYIGPVGDGGWTYAHDAGRKHLVEKLEAEGVKTIVQESVSEDNVADVEKALKDMVDQGANIIFATSFGYMDPVLKVAKENPEVKFMHCSGYKTADNVSSYFGRIYEARYLSGIVAGMKTKTNTIGYVAAYPIAEVVRGINAFTLGVKSVNPDATVKVRWTSTWYDPAKEKEAAKSLLDENADVIAQHQDTAGPQQAAEERNVFSIGYNSDMKDMAPKAYMTAPIWNWGPYYVEQVKAVMDGTWKSESHWEGMNEGIVALAPLTENAPEGAQAKVDEAMAKIKDGSFNVFAGPIKDQEGNVKVEEGKSLDDAALTSFDWFVEGVEGKIEK